MSRSQDFDLNITPIIDSFTVLITFMLASASFLSVGIFDAGISAAGVAPTDQAPPSVNVEVDLAPNKTITIKLTGRVTQTTPIAARGGNWNLEELTRTLGSVKATYKDVSAATLVAENAVPYKDVIVAMESTRKSLPYVMLGGF